MSERGERLGVVDSFCNRLRALQGEGGFVEFQAKETFYTHQVIQSFGGGGGDSGSFFFFVLFFPSNDLSLSLSILPL